MKYLLLLSMLILIPIIFMGQTLTKLTATRTGFIYVEGISWAENQEQDKILEIFVEGDTMTAIRNLLLYCLQEKEENEHAYYVLSRLNLDHISTIIKNNDFDFYLKEYRRVVKKNELKRVGYPKNKK